MLALARRLTTGSEHSPVSNLDDIQHSSSTNNSQSSPASTTLLATTISDCNDSVYVERSKDLHNVSAAVESIGSCVEKVESAAFAYVSAIQELADVYAVLAKSNDHRRPEPYQAIIALKKDLSDFLKSEVTTEIKKEVDEKVIAKLKPLKIKVKKAEGISVTCERPLKKLVKYREKVQKQEVKAVRSLKSAHGNQARRDKTMAATLAAVSRLSSNERQSVTDTLQKKKTYVKAKQNLLDWEKTFKSGNESFDREYVAMSNDCGFLAFRQVDTVLKTNMQFIRSLEDVVQKAWQRFPGGKADEENRQRLARIAAENEHASHHKLRVPENFNASRSYSAASAGAPFGYTEGNHYDRSNIREADLASNYYVVEDDGNEDTVNGVAVDVNSWMGRNRSSGAVSPAVMNLRHGVLHGFALESSLPEGLAQGGLFYSRGNVYDDNENDVNGSTIVNNRAAVARRAMEAASGPISESNYHPATEDDVSRVSDNHDHHDHSDGEDAKDADCRTQRGRRCEPVTPASPSRNRSVSVPGEAKNEPLQKQTSPPRASDRNGGAKPKGAINATRKQPQKK